MFIWLANRKTMNEFSRSTAYESIHIETQALRTKCKHAMANGKWISAIFTTHQHCRHCPVPIRNISVRNQQQTHTNRHTEWM